MNSSKDTLGINTALDVSMTCCGSVRVGVPVGSASVLTNLSM